MVITLTRAPIDETVTAGSPETGYAVSAHLNPVTGQPCPDSSEIIPDYDLFTDPDDPLYGFWPSPCGEIIRVCRI